jgi:hypothetical protein|nr:MAG TPA: hypothetical protein [Caudoviricetes sp.]
MDAVEFVKTVNRLCKNRHCDGCPVAKEGRCMVGFDYYSVKNIEKTISKVEQWAKEHPVKTRQSEFLKRFPNADLTRLQPCMIEKDKRPMWCGKYADFGANGCCDECRYAYWNEEVDN